MVPILVLSYIIGTMAIAAFPQELLENPPLYCASVSREHHRHQFIENRTIPPLKTHIDESHLKQVQVNDHYQI